MIRILLQALGVQGYAVFVLMAGLVNWYVIADFGVGFSIQNFVSERRARDAGAADLLGTVALISVGLLVVILGLLLATSGVLGNTFLRQFSFLSSSEKTRIFFVISALLVTGNIGGIAYKIWYAEQRGFLSNLLPAAASLTGLGAVLLVAHTHTQQKLWWSLLGFNAPIAGFALLSFAYILATHQLDFRFDRALVAAVLKRGSHFWFFSLMSTIVLQVDYLIVSQVLPPGQIVVYNIGSRIYYLIFFFYTSALLAIWPLFTEKISRGEWHQVSGICQRYIVAGTLFVLCCTMFVWRLSGVIAALLSPRETTVIPRMFVLLLGTYFVLRVWTDTFATVLQSMSDLKALWICVPIQAAISAAAQWVLARRYGVNGIVLGLICSYLATVAWALPMVVFRRWAAKRSVAFAEICDS